MALTDEFQNPLDESGGSRAQFGSANLSRCFHATFLNQKSQTRKRLFKVFNYLFEGQVCLPCPRV